jgi:hypothetical protein
MTRLRLTRSRNAIVLVAGCAMFYWATAQNVIKNAPLAPATTAPAAPAASAPEGKPCPAPRDVQARDLYGNWTLEISPVSAASKPQIGRIELEKNPEYADSVSGWLWLADRKIFVAGDIDDGVLSLEESDDGQRISAVWDGQIAQGSCAKAITGTRRVGEVETRFVLRRTGGWN